MYRILGCAFVLAFIASSVFQVGSSIAQDTCTCVVPVASGPVGLVSQASADVFHTGAIGRVPALSGVELFSGSVVTTGAMARADIDLGETCQFAMSGSMRMQITPANGALCVQVFDEGVPAQSTAPSGAVALAGALGGGVLLSLGLLQSVSQ